VYDPTRKSLIGDYESFATALDVARRLQAVVRRKASSALRSSQWKAAELTDDQKILLHLSSPSRPPVKDMVLRLGDTETAVRAVAAEQVDRGQRNAVGMMGPEIVSDAPALGPSTPPRITDLRQCAQRCRVKAADVAGPSSGDGCWKRTTIPKPSPLATATCSRRPRRSSTVTSG